MPNDAVTPDLSKLDKNYQILTELHAEDGSRTYLARHLRFNRDVTITVTWLLDDDNNALTHFAADAHLLMAMRHPNIIPVIEGIWLDERTFAIVRARVRGATLEQTIAAGPAPIARVATTIQQVESAISWARSSGVVHRNVTARSIVFQQGNGRVLLSLEPRPLAADAMPGECDDARSIGQVASEMLSGRFEDDNDRSAAIIPPRIVPAVAEALEAVRLCDRTSASTSLASLRAALDSNTDRPGPATVEQFSEREVPILGAAPEPTVTAATEAVPPVDRVPMPRARVRPGMLREPAVVAAPSSFGFNARLGSALAVAAILSVLALGVFRHQRAPIMTTTLATDDTTRQAAGDVAMGASRVDSVAPITTPAPAQQPVAAVPTAATRPTTISPLDTVTRQPLKTATPSAPTRDTSAAAVAGVAAEPCVSPESEDQHKCLMAAIDRNDRELNSVFGKLVAALRRQASAAASDPDPDTVEELRATQRKWLEDRDAACREVGERPLYARERSSCFAQQSSDRVRELKKLLETVPPT